MLLSIRQNNFTTSLRRRFPTSLWSCHIVAMKTSNDVAKTTSLRRLIMTSPNETLQQHRFCNVVRRFHRNYIATSERRWVATSQQRCNDVTVSAGKQPMTVSYRRAVLKEFVNITRKKLLSCPSFSKKASLGLQTYYKRTPSRVLSC